MTYPGRAERETQAREALEVALSCAVPLWSMRIRGYDDATCQRRAGAAGQLVGCYGDVLLFGRNRRRSQRSLIDLYLRLGMDKYGYRDKIDPPPSPGEIFNALAEGMAIALRFGGEPAAQAMWALLRIETPTNENIQRQGETWQECKARRRQERRSSFDAADVETSSVSE